MNTAETGTPLQTFIAAGIRAANTHNAQPWKFVLHPEDRRIAIAVERSRVLPASDPESRQSVVSLGCAAENMLIAAAANNFLGGLTIRGQEMELAFQSSGAPLPDAALAPFIATRKVIRADFDREQKIPESLRQEIFALVVPHALEALLLEDADSRRAIAELQGQADGFVMNDRDFLNELGDWLLPNDTGSALGMPGAVFGLKDDQALRLHRGFKGVEPLQPEDALRFALGAKRLMEQTPCIMVLAVAYDDFAHWVRAGRALQRILLLAAQGGLAASIHAGIIEVPMIRDALAATLGLSSFPIAVVRLGFLKNKKDGDRLMTRRLAVEDVIAAA